jgi:AcrR family transcriptional regulator
MTARKASDEKAALILEAAAKVLLRQGYSRTTIKEVAATAGVSRGLLHYYFKSKEEMLFKVVRRTVEDSLQLTRAVLSQSHTTEELAANICMAMRQFAEQSPEFINIMIESWSLARQSHSAHDELEAVYTLFREGLAKGLEEAIERGVFKPSTPVLQIATIITAFIDGLSFELMVLSGLREDPEFWQAGEKALAAMLNGF